MAEVQQKLCRALKGAAVVDIDPVVIGGFVAGPAVHHEGQPDLAQQLYAFVAGARAVISAHRTHLDRVRDSLAELSALAAQDPTPPQP